MSFKRKVSSYQGDSHGFDDIHSQDPRAKRKKFDSHRHHRAGHYFHKDNIASKFPHLEEWVHDDDGPDSLGITKLEVKGLRGFRHVRCPQASKPCPSGCDRYACHIDSLIIACDGACPHNGTSKVVRSSFGVFFGESDEAEDYNQSRLVPELNINEERPVQHTSQRAELWGAIAALNSAKPFVKDGGQWVCGDEQDCMTSYGPEKVGKNGCKVRCLIIKSDSAYLVNSITGHVNKWVANGWQTAKKTPVANQDLWRLSIIKLSELGELGASVAFWLVPRDENEDADELANDAL
ncbi:Ribonuclease H-like domain containing protein [Rhypophila decipiens]